MTPPSQRGWAHLTRLIAIELTAMPSRIDRALQTLGDARSPLKASSYEAQIRGSPPDPGPTELAIQAAHDRQRLIAALRQIDALTRGVGCILDEWAPNHGAIDATWWCDNCLKYGVKEPRAADGSTNCRWCCDVHRTWNLWPTRALIQLHTKGRRITETEYRRLLGKGAA